MMTSRERWLAALHHEPVDCLPFWPKLGGSYVAAQKQPYNQQTLEELQRYIGSDPQVGAPDICKDIHHRGAYTERLDKHCQVTGREVTGREVTWSINGHDLKQVMHYDPGSASWHPMSFPIRQKDDLSIMTDWFNDLRVEVDTAAIEDAKSYLRQVGGTGFAVTNIGESPLMQFVEWLAGVERAHYFLADCKAEVEALFDAIHRYLQDRTDRICAHHPAPLAYMIENTSTTLISPAQYRTYCYGHILDYATIARSHDKLMALHMCGHLKLLLPDLETLPVAAFEAFTSPSLGNTTLLDGRTQCPTKCLIGGTNACLWTCPKEDIIAQLDHDLSQLPHHRGLVISSAGVMPPSCPPETIKAVCEWVHSFAARN